MAVKLNTAVAMLCFAACTGPSSDSGASKSVDTGETGPAADTGTADSDTGGADTVDTDTAQGETGADTGGEDTDPATDTCAIDTAPWGAPCEAEGCKLTGSEGSTYILDPPTFDGGGDADGDGGNDLLVGLNGFGSLDEGKAYLIRGGHLGSGRLDDVDFTSIAGTPEDTEVGRWGVLLRDFDADGIGDVVLSEGPDTSARVFPGPFSCDRTPGDATAILTSIHRGSDGLIGRFLDAGDFNGDGLPDLLIGDGTETVVWLVPAPFSGELELDDVAMSSVAHDSSTGDPYYDDDAGATVVGDADGDGLDDIVVIGDADVSAVYLFLAGVPGESQMTDANAEWRQASGDHTTYHGRRSADLDGDGYLDLALGVYPGNESMIDIEYGPFNGSHTLPGEDGVTPTDDGTDRTLSGTAIVDDLDGDGTPELAIGAVDPGYGPGVVYLVSGEVRGISSVTDIGVDVLHGDGVDGIGGSLTQAPDLDGDGLPELLVAAPGDDDEGEDAGAVWILPGANLLSAI